MTFGIRVEDETMEEILNTLDRIVENPDELEHWLETLNVIYTG